MNRILFILPAIVLLFTVACASTSANSIAQKRPVVSESSERAVAVPVPEGERTAPEASKEAPAAYPQERERDFSVTMHHWMALLAIKNNDVNDASHHLQDAMAFLNDPKHMGEMQKLMALMAKGKLYDAEHSIEEMAGGESISRVKVQRYHLQSAGKSIERRDLASVKRHMEDFMVQANDKQKSIASELLQKAEKGDFRGAEYALVELIKR